MAGVGTRARWCRRSGIRSICAITHAGVSMERTSSPRYIRPSTCVGGCARAITTVTWSRASAHPSISAECTGLGAAAAVAPVQQSVRGTQRVRTIVHALAAALLLLSPADFRLSSALGPGNTAAPRIPRPASRTTSPEIQSADHLRVIGTHFVKPDGSRFQWRGITAFRLVEFVADAREAEADAYLKWAASKKLTVVRVLVMADMLFKLSPADGVRSLPTLLEIASRHGLYVEVVALADTAHIEIDIPAHVRTVGEICDRFGNALLEIANEPVHPTQTRALHDPAYLQQLARMLPKGLPVSLGSVGENDGYGAGDYLTWHAPRGPEQVRALAQGAALIR